MCRNVSGQRTCQVIDRVFFRTKSLQSRVRYGTDATVLYYSAKNGLVFGQKWLNFSHIVPGSGSLLADLADLFGSHGLLQARANEHAHCPLVTALWGESDDLPESASAV
jgi:hypothetical protein